MKIKKSLGQHFLTNQKAIFEIVNAGELEKGDFVLEIGPGKGVLTEKILEKGVRMISVEKDTELIPFLKEKFEKEILKNKLLLSNQDILNINVETLFKDFSSQKLLRYKLIANIPYYITGAIIEKFLSTHKKPERLVLLIQKEVAERIVAKNKKESILSLAVKFYGDPKIIYKVSAGSFFPKPKVDSAVLLIKIKDHLIDKNLEANYLKIVKQAFSHKRKIALNNLKNLEGLNVKKHKLKKKDVKIDFENIFEKLNINKKIRAEDIDFETFIKIAKNIE